MTGFRGAGLSGLLPGRRPPRYGTIWLATGLLFAVSPLLAPSSVSGGALLSMLPFASLLTIASVGQTLVVQQRGLDLSVAGMITLATIIVTKYPNGAESKLPAAIGLVAVACLAAGALNGLAVAVLGITPLVATLGVNALLTGVTYEITSGQATASSTSGLASFAVGTTVGVPNTLLIALGVVFLVAVAVRTSVIGRRFVAAGANPEAARAAGVRVRRYQVVTYLVAGLSYGVAGVLVAGFLQTPGIGAGDDYLLPTLVAVVLGGTSLAGGSGSVVATAAGALFLTQLELVVDAMGVPQSVNDVVQGGIIATAMAIRTVPWRQLATLPAALARFRGLPHPHVGRAAPGFPLEDAASREEAQ